MRVSPTVSCLLLVGMLEWVGCAGRSETDGAAGIGGMGAAGGSGGVGGFGGDPCRTPEGLRLCGGSAAACGWAGPEECPGGGCARPFDRVLGGEAVAGICFSDLTDNGSRSCFNCNDGEVCIERAQGELVCVPESVCAGLWDLGAKGVCRYADLGAYDGRALPVLSQCPNPKPESLLCGGPCPGCTGDSKPACTGRSPDHPQGFCTSFESWCGMDASGYVQKCSDSLPKDYCGVFHVSAADEPVARLYGRCMGLPTCETLAAGLPGGFDCYDETGSLVTASAAQ